jgi:hypothetical protein
MLERTYDTDDNTCANPSPTTSTPPRSPAEQRY